MGQNSVNMTHLIPISHDRHMPTNSGRYRTQLVTMQHGQRHMQMGGRIKTQGGLESVTQATTPADTGKDIRRKSFVTKDEIYWCFVWVGMFNVAVDDNGSRSTITA